MNSLNVEITLIGNDPALAYLIHRYADQSGCRFNALREPPTLSNLLDRKPCLVIFTSIDHLEAAQALVSELADDEIPVGVCASMADEARAHELGADHCLIHPLTYDGFMAIFFKDDTAGV